MLLGGTRPTRRYAINFRATAGFVTDRPTEISLTGLITTQFRVISGQVYHKTITQGWENRDRNSGVDPRIAGCWFQSNADTRYAAMWFKIPPGRWRIRPLFGDVSFDQRIFYEFLDDQQSIWKRDYTATSLPANNWMDAWGTVFTSLAAWDAGNKPIELYIGSGWLGLHLGGQNASASTLFSSTIAHLILEPVDSQVLPASLMYAESGAGYYGTFPRRRNVQPAARAIDWSNPITRGLVRCYDVRSARELVVNSALTKNGVPVYQDCVAGRGRRNPTNGNEMRFSGGPPIGGLSECAGASLVWVPDWNYLSTVGTTKSFFRNDLCFTPLQSNSGFILKSVIWLPGITFGNGLALSSMSRFDGKPLLVVTNFVSGNGMDMYFNNEPPINTPCSGTVQAPTKDTCIGGNENNIEAADATMLWAGFWNRALTRQEIASLTANPWQIFLETSGAFGAGGQASVLEALWSMFARVVKWRGN